MEVINLSLKGLKLVIPKVFRDGRGYFLESFHASKYKEAGIECDFVQDNYSFSKRGTIRGMHFQSEPGQAKLISVAVGRIYDVAVDIRTESPTFGMWQGIYLDEKERRQLFIPVGFAHGFCVVSDEAHVTYKVSSEYNAETEKGFHCQDSQVGISWPITRPILSEKDLKSPAFRELFATA